MYKRQTLAKIIYIADYIEPNRDFEGVEKLRRLAYENIDEAIIAGIDETLSLIHIWPLLCACDVYRPAAVKQLQVVGGQLELPVYAEEGVTDAVGIAKRGLEHAVQHSNDVFIIDTAGRLHIDEQLMDELKEIVREVSPTEILLVVDAMTGQDAVNVADKFNSELEISGVVLTKLDGDTRGGAASVSYTHLDVYKRQGQRVYGL